GLTTDSGRPARALLDALGGREERVASARRRIRPIRPTKGYPPRSLPRVACPQLGQQRTTRTPHAPQKAGFACPQVGQLMPWLEVARIHLWAREPDLGPLR